MAERDEIVSFLTATVTGDKGFFCLLFAPDDLHEEFFEWPSQLDQIVDRVLDPASTNVYFSPHLFSQRSSEKQYVLPTRTIVADLDYANLQDLQVAPTTLVESSPNRHQGYWVLREQLPLQELEQLSKKLSYSIPSCDTSGWWLGHKFRIPGTRNFKYNPPATVKYASAYSTERPTSLSELTMWVGETPVDNVKSVAQGEEWLNSLPTQLDKGPRETLEKFRTQIGAKPTMYYNQQQPDRSEALWALMSALFRAGASRDEVFWIAKHSANNKFADSKYHNDRDLAKDVLRCERAMSEERTDIRMTIAVAMKMPGNAVDRKRLITRLVVSELEKRGEFIKTTDDRLWYMNHQTGRPVYLSKHSPSLEAILDQVFDLNPQDGYQPYVIGHIVSLAHTKGRTVPIGILSDASADRLLLHDGRGGVYNITPSGFKREINGTHNILFPWRAAGEEPIIIGEPLDEDWTDWLFDSAWFDNLVELTPVQARMLVKVWFHFILFREWAMTRPILALFGQAGCLSADTQLELRRGAHSSRFFTLKQIYENQHSILRHGNWDRTIPLRIKSVNRHGIVEWKQIHDVVYSGVKTTFTIKVVGSEPFRATADHQFLTPSGFKKLSDLSVGDLVTVRGDILKSKGRNYATRRETKAHYHPDAVIRFIGNGRYGHIPYYRAVVEADMNSMTVDAFIQAICNEKKASTLKYLPSGSVIHHKDEDPTNNDLSNLEVRTKDSHDRHHGYSNQRNFGTKSGLWETVDLPIESIELFGEEPTYDIQMLDEEAPNFLINDVVVHNSGKTTLFHLVYNILYGRFKSLNTVTTPFDFDSLTANDPLAVFDGVDTPEHWLADRLSQAAAKSEIVKRKLYTDADVVTLRRQAILGVTAHDPQFTRNDVVDRLIILNFKRREQSNFIPATIFIERIWENRERIWGSIVKEAQLVLAQPWPSLEEIPNFRISDFARVGMRIAQALGKGDLFYETIVALKRSQVAVQLSNDDTLINAIALWHRGRNGSTPEYVTAGYLHDTLAMLDDSFRNSYRTSSYLGRKLWVLQSTLREVFDITAKFDDKLGVRLWRIDPKK